MGFGRIRRHPRSAPRRGSVLPGVDTHEGPRYSVVIPAFNEQAYLNACLASLAAQDYPGAFEVIVVDNNSTDDTAVPAARRRRPRLAHHREPAAPAAPTGRRPVAGTRARRTICGEVRNGSRERH